MKCTYRKLKESVTDTSLPTLPIVVRKTYAYDTDTSQTVAIDEIVAAARFENLKIEAVVKWPLLGSSVSTCVAFGTRGGIQLIASQSGKAWVEYGDSNNSLKVTVPADTDVTYVIDSQNNKVSVDETVQDGSGTGSTGGVRSANIFSTRVVAGNCYIKSIKITDQSTDTLIAELVPATVNGVGAFLNTVTGKTYFPNSGTLGTV